MKRRISLIALLLVFAMLLPSIVSCSVEEKAQRQTVLKKPPKLLLTGMVPKRQLTVMKALKALKATPRKSPSPKKMMRVA
jgi:hypothetical protein